MRSRMVLGLAIAVVGLVFCGVGLGVIPGIATLSPRHVALAQGEFLSMTVIDNDYNISTLTPDPLIVAPSAVKWLNAWAVYSDMSYGTLRALETVTWELDDPGSLGSITYNSGDVVVVFTAGPNPGTLWVLAHADPSIPAEDPAAREGALEIRIVGPVSAFVPEGELIFPMTAAPNIFVVSPPTANTTFLPLRAATNSPEGTDRVTFDSGFLGVDYAAPYSGAYPNIYEALFGYTITAEAYSVFDPFTVAATASVNIDVNGLPDSDDNGIPEFGTTNTPFVVTTPGAYVAEVPSATREGKKVYVGIATIGSNTAPLVNLVTGSNVLLQAPEDVMTANDARLIVRTAELPEDLSPWLALERPEGFPLGAIDAHIIGAGGSSIEDLNPDAPLTIRIPVSPDMPQIGIPILAAETNLDEDFNIEVATAAWVQAPIHYQIVDNEYVFSVSHLTTYMPLISADAPRILTIEPASGPMAGGTDVTITFAMGTDPGQNLEVTFDGNAATVSGVMFNTMELAGAIACVTPPYPPDGGVDVPVDVRVIRPADGGEGGGLDLFDIIEGGFTYLAAPAPQIVSIVPDSGPTSGGTTATINGSNFQDGATVTIGGNAATVISITPGLLSQIVVTTPPGAAGLADVTVTNPDTQSDTLESGFEYVAPPNASFTWNQISGTLTIQFTNTSTGQITGYAWTFGDEGGSFAQSPSHTYAAAGSYLVTLTAYGPYQSDSDTQTVRVREPGETRKRGGAGGPCFVATAAYGTPMADQIDVLRSFRDRYLLTNAVGTSLVKAYYSHSPAVANVIADNAALRAIARAVLMPVIAPLWMKLVALAAVVAAVVRRKRTA